MRDADLIIIGAGPAGMAAAATASKGGARVLLLDEQPQAGGQIYRNVGVNNDTRSYLGAEYAAGRPLVDALDTAGITAEFGATVWHVEAGPRVLWSRDGVSHVCAARHVLLAGGAQERPVPFPGWTLPGVMPAGAAQILMKSAGLLPRDAVLAGSGPLLYLIAAQMIDAGAPPRTLVETQTAAMMLRSSRHLPRAFLAAPTLIKGLGLIRKIKAAGVARYTRASGFRAKATEDGNVAFSFTAKGRAHHLTTPLLLTHQGVVPATHMSRAAGVAHEWNDAQQAIQPKLDAWGQTDIPGIHVAGDGAGIGGAEAAQAAGRLAALDILHQMGLFDEVARDRKAAPDRAAHRSSIFIRPFLDAAYAPLPEFLAPKGDTIVCRCEEVTAADIRGSVKEGANGPRQVKTATRAGMGPCQGRMCDLTVRGILASCGTKPATPRARSPIKPVKLGELAALASHQET
ncbi:FAD/NAD(P)-dependent oxidoreductase [Leisingera caerulea]|uniref:FAD/NAD(P)-dependent oxidoreductase n=1 Tax=Leisingera caerulea TaxID=506591 RepID=UPI0021A7A765|nr:NAD(P)/FAD-dependent oxidoreductase [Leisingera caerulea]UWQ85994.1 NAD(P)/FAD-dependent oxidoreductase [Leisingera caerulea]